MWALGALFVAGCAETEKATTDSGLVKSNFQTEVGGKKTDLYVLRNQNNMEVCVTNFGGRIVSVMVPDKEGVMRDVVLGFDSIQDYISKPSDFGASIGRYANRSIRENLLWMELNTSCRAITTDIACTVVRKDSNIRYTMPSRWDRRNLS